MAANVPTRATGTAASGSGPPASSGGTPGPPRTPGRRPRTGSAPPPHRRPHELGGSYTMAYFIPAGNRGSRSAILALTRLGRLEGVRPGQLEHRPARATGGRRACWTRRSSGPRVRPGPRPSAGPAARPAAGLDDDLAERCSSGSRPWVLRASWNACPAGAGGWPICPADTWTFCARMASSTSSGREVRVGHPVRVEPHPDRVVPRPEAEHVPDPRQPGQFVLDLEGGVVAHLELVVLRLAGRRVVVREHVDRRGGWPSTASWSSPRSAGPPPGSRGWAMADPVLDEHLGLVRVGPDLERDGQPRGRRRWWTGAPCRACPRPRSPPARSGWRRCRRRSGRWPRGRWR